MDAAGLPTVHSERIESLIWGKAAYNAALNPLSALLDVPYGRLPEIPEAREMMDAVIEELYAVGRARGADLDPPTADAYRALFYEKLVPPTAAHAYRLTATPLLRDSPAIQPAARSNSDASSISLPSEAFSPSTASPLTSSTSMCPVHRTEPCSTSIAICV